VFSLIFEVEIGLLLPVTIIISIKGPDIWNNFVICEYYEFAVLADKHLLH
jgi:hypothetical protein